MIADLKPYEEYKESGLPWLGQVPTHWEVKKPKQIGDLLKGVGGTKEDSRSEGVPCVRYGELYTTHQYFVRRPKAFVDNSRAAAYTPIRYGDVLFAASGEKLDEIGKSAVNLIEGCAVCGGDVIVLRPRIPVHAPFLGYALDCRPSATQKSIMGRGTTVKHIYPDELKQLQVAFPPLAEQAAIVRFLDWANGRLERTIRAKRKVIALLNEQKQAIIHRAVTRGLDPAVTLKPSNIPWVGDIPIHWELSPNRAFLRIRKVLVGERHSDFTLLSLTKRGVIVRDLTGMRGKFSSDMGTSQEVRLGDLVLCLFDVPETPRTVGLSRHTGMITGAYTVLECKREDVAAFLELFYIAMDDRKLLSPMYSGLRNTIPKERFLGSKTPIPPKKERAEILVAVREHTALLDTAISLHEIEINHLREYRTRLVSDVVTGKLDVRGVSKKLPDDTCSNDFVVGIDEESDVGPGEDEATS